MNHLGKLGLVALSLGTFATVPKMFTSERAATQAQDVNVVNTPLPVDLDDPARNRFQASCQSPPFSDSGAGGCNIATVPAGKRLVIETVTAKVEVAPNRAVDTVDLAITQDAITTRHYLAVILVGRSGARDFYTITAPVRLYVDEGTNVRVSALTESTGNMGNVYASISGHLVTP